MSEVLSADVLANKLAARIYVYEMLHIAFGASDARTTLEIVGSSDASVALAAYCGEGAAGEGVDALAGEVGAASAPATEGTAAPAPLPLAECWQRCVNAAAQANADEASQAYTDLFLVPGETYVYPWESCHTDDNATLFKPSTGAVKRFFEEHGYQLKTDGGNFPPDHVAAMLDFLARLSQRAYELFADKRDVEAAQAIKSQREFTDEHILNWVDSFAEGVAEKDASGVYAALAGLLIAFVSEDRRFEDAAGALLEGGVPRSEIGA